MREVGMPQQISVDWCFYSVVSISPKKKYSTTYMFWIPVRGNGVMWAKLVRKYRKGTLTPWMLLILGAHWVNVLCYLGVPHQTEGPWETHTMPVCQAQLRRLYLGRILWNGKKLMVTINLQKSWSRDVYLLARERCILLASWEMLFTWSEAVITKELCWMMFGSWLFPMRVKKMMRVSAWNDVRLAVMCDENSMI